MLVTTNCRLSATSWKKQVSENSISTERRCETTCEFQVVSSPPEAPVDLLGMKVSHSRGRKERAFGVTTTTSLVSWRQRTERPRKERLFRTSEHLEESPRPQTFQ
jgi:hypothetical protein